ncbi:MAG: hypothetical protein PHT79_10690 [Syntrophomonadaceae bacterium]|nr:hypothetical protein [Syntrophomonadaceae bacterium]MDD4550210.1 hypothetical protein [Syntrophomonadaceae bacterium]
MDIEGKKREEKDMDAVLEKAQSDLTKFFKQHKNTIKQLSNISKNKDGIVVIPKDDEWRKEVEWDKLYKELKDK